MRLISSSTLQGQRCLILLSIKMIFVHNERGYPRFCGVYDHLSETNSYNYHSLCTLVFDYDCYMRFVLLKITTTHLLAFLSIPNSFVFKLNQWWDPKNRDTILLVHSKVKLVLLCWVLNWNWSMTEGDTWDFWVFLTIIAKQIHITLAVYVHTRVFDYDCYVNFVLLAFKTSQPLVF